MLRQYYQFLISRNIPHDFLAQHWAGIIVGMGSANERWRYFVMPSLIGWAHIPNDPSWEWSVVLFVVKWNEQHCGLMKPTCVPFNCFRSIWTMIGYHYLKRVNWFSEKVRNILYIYGMWKILWSLYNTKQNQQKKTYIVQSEKQRLRTWFSFAIVSQTFTERIRYSMWMFVKGHKLDLEVVYKIDFLNILYL